MPSTACHINRIHRLTLILAICLLLPTAAVFVGCSRNNQQNEKIVATCNGYEIKYEELRFVTMLYKDTLAATYGSDIWDDPVKAESYRAELEEMVQEHLRENYVILTTCADYNINLQIDGDEAQTYADKQIDEFIDQAFEGKKKLYREWLSEHWMTEGYFTFSLKVNYLESVLFYTLLDGGLFHFDTENIDEYIDYILTGDGYARTIQVFIRNDKQDSPEANLAEAQMISQALQAAGNAEAREQMMRTYIGSSVNEDLYDVSGDGYYFTKGEMDSVYEEVAFNLEVGEASEAFACSGGYYVIMRLSPEEDYVMTNCATLLRNYQIAMLGLLEDHYRDDCTVIWNEYGQTIDLVTME